MGVMHSMRDFASPVLSYNNSDSIEIYILLICNQLAFQYFLVS